MLIADVNEMKSGRRRVDEKEVAKIFNNVHVCDSEGIEWEEFRQYFEKMGGFIHVFESHYILPTACE